MMTKSVGPALLKVNMELIGMFGVAKCLVKIRLCISV